MNETRILIRLLGMYFPWNWEFGSALAKLQNFGRVLTPLPPPLGTPLKV
jgi:ABC-type glycerol-3-phosphate transport system substrate-binding protein